MKHPARDTAGLRNRLHVAADFIASAVTVLVMACGAAAQGTDGNVPEPRSAILPGTGYIVVPTDFTKDASGRSLKELRGAIAAWLILEFDLPKASAHARIAFVPPGRMARLRFRDVSPVGPVDDGSEVLAVYNDDARTIYLPLGWTGETPADLSVLVHETVHHLQNAGRLKFACAEEREKMAFAAQERLLEFFGGSLETDFGLDPFTILVRTNCPP